MVAKRDVSVTIKGRNVSEKMNSWDGIVPFKWSLLIYQVFKTSNFILQIMFFVSRHPMTRSEGWYCPVQMELTYLSSVQD